MFTERGGLYLLDAVTSHKSKILDRLGKITEPGWSRVAALYERRINSSDGHRPPLQLMRAKAFRRNALQCLESVTSQNATEFITSRLVAPRPDRDRAECGAVHHH